MMSFDSYEMGKTLAGLRSLLQYLTGWSLALDHAHVAFPEHGAKGTDFYGDKVGEAVARLAFEAQVRRGTSDLLAVTTIRDAVDRSRWSQPTVVYQAGTLLVVEGWELRNNPQIRGDFRTNSPSPEAPKSPREALSAPDARYYLRVMGWDGRTALIDPADLTADPDSIRKARPFGRKDNDLSR